MNSWRTPLAAGLWTFAFGAAVAGAVQPFNDSQPSLVINELMPARGIFPSRGSGDAVGGTLGFVYGFAGPFAPSVTASTTRSRRSSDSAIPGRLLFAAGIINHKHTRFANPLQLTQLGYPFR